MNNKYIPRLIDQQLNEILNSMGAVYIRGPNGVVSLRLVYKIQIQ